MRWLLNFSHQGQYIYWTEMGIVQLLAPGGLQLSYPRLKRAAVADLGTVESFPDAVQGGDVRRANDGTMILVGKAQNLIFSIANPDATTPTVLGPVPLNSGGYTFVLHPNMALQPLVITKDSPVKQRSIGEKQYELSDHLGNVRVVLSDVKEGDWDAGTSTITDYRPQLNSRADYYAFGSLLPGRNYSSGSYRFGFQGQERNDEISVVTSVNYHYEDRFFDSRLGRWSSVDPLASKYPYNSPFVGMGNSPLLYIDRKGQDIHVYLSNSSGERMGKPVLIIATDRYNGSMILPIVPEGVPLSSLSKLFDSPMNANFNDPSDSKEKADAFMIDVGIGFAFVGGMGVSVQIVDIRSVDDQGIFVYKTVDANVGMDVGLAINIGAIDFNEKNGESKLDRQTFTGKSQKWSLSWYVSGSRVSAKTESGKKLYTGNLVGSGAEFGGAWSASKSFLWFSLYDKTPLWENNTLGSVPESQ